MSLAVAAGAPLAAARTAVAVLLIGSWAQLVAGTGVDWVVITVECGLGVLILYVVPGTWGRVDVIQCPVVAGRARRTA